MGAITVTGVTMTTTEEYLGTNELAADPITEYPLGKKSIVMEDGQTSGDIQLILPYNSGSSAPKVFTFMLTSVAYDGESVSIVAIVAYSIFSILNYCGH